MEVPRLKWLHIQGLRSLRDVRLDLNGLRAIIGENGSGKTSLVEALQILRLAATEYHFVQEFAARHGDIREMVSVGASELRLDVEFETAEGGLRYGLSLATVAHNVYPTITREEIVDESGSALVRRSPTKIVERVSETYQGRVVELDSSTSIVGPSSSGLYVLGGNRIAAGLRAIGVYSSPDVRPTWRRADPRSRSAVREPVLIEQVLRLDSTGANLASVFQEFRSRDVRTWTQVLDEVRAGFGSTVTDVVVKPRQPGSVMLALRISGTEVPASQLSDGQLGFLFIVALRHLGTRYSVVAFDEPELHMHPQLAVRATWLLKELSADCPVILTTHADAVLDALESDEAVRVLERDDAGDTRLLKLDRAKLELWRDTFSSVSALRREGLLPELAVPATPYVP